MSVEELITKRRINPGAEKWMGIENPVLDHGFVQLVNYMGDDNTIEEAARVSYGAGTRKVSETEVLIRYLRRNAHTTPFEMCELAFRIRLPISVARQLIRHRTANINEYSTRYSLVPDVFYLIDSENIGVQSSSNRQGRGEIVNEQTAEIIRNWLSENSENSFETYSKILNVDENGKPIDPQRPLIARETARDALTLNFYTEMIWKMDLHNLFHFLKLRLDDHAQFEIRQFATAIADVTKDAFPIAWKAFEDYELFATHFSKPERDVLAELLKLKQIKLAKQEVLQLATQLGFTNIRERREFLDKLKGLMILDE